MAFVSPIGYDQNVIFSHCQIALHVLDLTETGVNISNNHLLGLEVPEFMNVNKVTLFPGALNSSLALDTVFCFTAFQLGGLGESKQLVSRRGSPEAVGYYQRALAGLNERLRTPSLAVSDLTLFVILGLLSTGFDLSLVCLY